MSLSQINKSINRRHFLKASALAAGAVFLHAAERIAPEDPGELHSVHLPMISSNALSCTWFVDSRDGCNENDGRTSRTPLRTLEELHQRGLQAGDRIYLRCGSHWREQLTLPKGTDNVLVAAYDEGNPPLLDCSDIQENATFIPTAGYAHVYHKDLAVSYLPSEPSWMSIWEDDVRLVRAASLEECDTSPGSYYAINDYTPNCTVYIHASDSSPIDQNGRRYECSVRHAGVYAFEARNITVEGLRCRRNFCDGGSIKVGPFATLRGCIAEEGNKHNAYIRTGSNVFGCKFSLAYYTQSSSMLVLNENTPADENTIIEDCIFEIDPGHPNADFIGPANSHHNVAGYFGTITLNNCIIKNFRIAGMVLAFNNAAQIVLNNPQFLECKFGLTGPFQSNAKPGCRTVVNGGIWQSSVPNQRAINLTVPVVPMVLNDFTIRPAANTDIGYVFLTAEAQIALIRCTVDIQLASGLRHAVMVNHAEAELAVYGTRFVGILGTSSWLYIANADSWESDYNTFESSFRSVVFGTPYTTLTDHQAGTGEDQNSVFVP